MVNTRPKVFTEAILLRLTLDEAREVYGCMADGETKAAFLRCALHRELQARGCHGHGDITMGMMHEDIRMGHGVAATTATGVAGQGVSGLASVVGQGVPHASRGGALWGDED